MKPIARSTSLERRLLDLRGQAPRRSPTVRVLAAQAQLTPCSLANLGFAAGVDFDRLLVGTAYAAPFGQSPFAILRGKRFEAQLRENGYASLLELLRHGLGFVPSESRIINLREGYPPNRHGLHARAHDTRLLIEQILRSHPQAPNLIDGAVLEAEVGGVRASFEADALAARVGDVLRVGEVKSFPVVDGRAEPDKAGAALDQAALYLLLLKRLVAECGGDPDQVSADALLITPKNVGLSPTLTSALVDRRIARMDTLLRRMPSAADVVATAPPKASFGPIADVGVREPARLDALHTLADRVGTAYTPTCLSTCGNARFCRARAYRDGAPCVLGPEATRLLPNVATLGRAADLSRGAPASPAEAPAAAQLERAGALYDVLMGPKAAGGGTKGGGA